MHRPCSMHVLRSLRRLGRAADQCREGCARTNMRCVEPTQGAALDARHWDGGGQGGDPRLHARLCRARVGADVRAL
eukprot:3092762-Pleurochrysis_carterae.AAC.2